jgi:hypothetical protein
LDSRNSSVLSVAAEAANTPQYRVPALDRVAVTVRPGGIMV